MQANLNMLISVGNLWSHFNGFSSAFYSDSFVYYLMNLSACFEKRIWSKKTSFVSLFERLHSFIVSK